MHWAFIRAAQTSVASLSVVPLQDVLGLGSEARMNTPSADEGNWKWRYQPGDLTAALAAEVGAGWLRSQTVCRQPASPPPHEDFFA